MLRIRFHGRGGQGMKTASRILGSACFLAGLEVQDAPRYGAERRGAPLFAFVRVDRRPILERGIIARPDLVVVSDPTLIPIPAAGVLAGLDDHSALLIASPEAAETWRQRLALKGPVTTFRPQGLSEGHGDSPLVGTACAAAAARLLGLFPVVLLEAGIRAELGALGEAVVERNLRIARATFEQLSGQTGRVTERPDPSPEDTGAPAWVELPFEEARISAPVIHGALTSNLVPTGLWRTLRPIIDYERCNRCWWVCSAFCPDGAITVEEGTPRIDYDHCKGCLVCVAQCPPHAIDSRPESELRIASQEHPA
ncbi:MAG: 2-oxoacid:acceptor oxidoreductase family protein [Bdellovibrio bacteriovorus]